MKFAFEPSPTAGIDIDGQDEKYPVGRIFCVGRNYAAHAAEMGAEVDREAPFYFTKFASAFCPNGTELALPPRTQDFHHEMELVVALAKPLSNATSADLEDAVFGYACGIDFTRRDLQQVAKDKRRPWDTGKNFENGALIGTITKAADFGEIAEQRIHLEVNGETRQDGKLSELIWSIEEILMDLSALEPLRPGDLIMTGTPAGVGAVGPGDVITGAIEGLHDINAKILPPLT